MSLAARIRDAVRERPFLHAALRAEVVNYTAATRLLDLDAEDQDAAVAALRRYATDLPDYDTTARDATVMMQSGLGTGAPADALLVVGETALVPDAGSLTGVLATGDVDPATLGHVLRRLDTEDVPVDAAGVAGEALLVVVERRDGADTLRIVEEALESVPVR